MMRFRMLLLTAGMLSACTPGTGVNYTTPVNDPIRPNSTVSLAITPSENESPEVLQYVDQELRGRLGDRLTAKSFAQVVGPDEPAAYELDIFVSHAVQHKEMAEVPREQTDSLFGNVLLLALGGSTGEGSEPHDLRWLETKVTLRDTSTGADVLGFDAAANGNDTPETATELVDYIGTGIECYGGQC